VATAQPGAELQPSTPDKASERGTRQARFGEDLLEATVFGEGEVEAEGPAIFELPGSTLVVPPGWTVRAGGDAVEMERAE
jgi:N-methylhydantoinase A/oxoprolinase/acetone carboxylase beta subunit